jgi:hypothetical protein
VAATDVSAPAPKRISKAAIRRMELLLQLWPNEGPKLWHRKKEDGFTTVPRTLSLILTLIDELGEGKDASPVYFDLWCRQMDDSFVEVTDEEAFAFSCGYTTPGRNVRSWRERVDILEKLGFVQIKPNGSRKYGYILLNHPHFVVAVLRDAGQISEAWWGAFVKRMSEIGGTMVGLYHGF